ncbi:MAG: hypothetical protein AABZ14_06870, partial [Candidatus Margulisiibacteriota bacterium]
MAEYSFRLKKDETPPVYRAQGIFVSGASAFPGWYKSPPDWLGAIDIDFSDAGFSNFVSISYGVSINVNGVTSLNFFDITDNSVVLGAREVSTNWAISWSVLQNGENEIWLSFRDLANNSVVTGPVLLIRKDTIVPTPQNNIATQPFVDPAKWYKAYDSRWMSTVDVDFRDAGGSHLSTMSYVVSWNGVSRQSEVLITNTRVQKIDFVVQNWPVDWAKLSNGTNDIYVEVSDLAGNLSSSYVVRMKKDEIAPSFNSHEVYSSAKFKVWYNNTQNYVNALPTFNVVFSDTGSSNISTLQYGVSWNGQSIGWTVISDNLGVDDYDVPFSIPWNQLTCGTNDILVQISDHAQNSTTSSVLFSILKDDVLPSFDISVAGDMTKWYRLPPAWIQQVSINFIDVGSSNLRNIVYGISNHTIPNISWITVTSNYGQSLYSTAWSLDWNALSCGTNNVMVSENDYALNQVSAVAFYIKKDDIPPTFQNRATGDLAIFSVWYNAPPAWLSRITVDFQDEGSSNIKSVDYGVMSYRTQTLLWHPIVSSVDQQAITSSWPISWDALLEGTNDVYVRVYDWAGNVVSGSVFSVLKDVTNPSHNSHEDKNLPKYTQWHNQTWFNQNSATYNTVSVSFSDTGSSNISTISYEIFFNHQLMGSEMISNNILQSTYALPWVVSWNLLTSGVNEIGTFVQDRATNWTRSDQLFTIKKDVISPSLVASVADFDQSRWYPVSPDNIAMIASSSFLDEGGSSLSRIERLVSFDGKLQNRASMASGPLRAWSNYWGLDWQSLTNGVNEVYVSFNDTAGNQVLSDPLFVFKKDEIYPRIVSHDFAEVTYNQWIRVTPSVASYSAVDIDFYDEGKSLLATVSYGISKNGELSSAITWIPISWNIASGS